MIYVKVYGRRNAGPEVHRLETFPSYIGRALDNAVIVSDKSISAKHAVIEKTHGGYQLRDLGSTNGICENGKRAEVIPLVQTKSVRVGNIWFEFSNSDDPVEETVRVDLNELVRDESWSHAKGWIICGGLVILALLLRYLDYRFLRVSFTTHALLAKSMSFVLAAFSLAAAVAVFSKVHRRRYQFYPLFAVILGFSIIGDLHFTLFNIVAFNLDSQLASKILDEFIGGAVIFVGCLLLGRLLFPETPPRRRASFILVGILVINGATYGLRAVNERNPSADVDTTIAVPLRSFPAEKHGLDLLSAEIDALEKNIGEAKKEILEKEAERRIEATR